MHSTVFIVQLVDVADFTIIDIKQYNIWKKVGQEPHSFVNYDRPCAKNVNLKISYTVS